LVRQLDGGRILIGAYQDNTFGTVAGAVYLYSTNGSLLTIFTNSAPYGSFGSSVATVGSDRILISAPSAGRVYLFDTNATQLVGFTNPSPATYQSYGRSIAVLNDAMVAVGAAGNGQPDPYLFGAVHLQAFDGSLILTITNPTPNFSFYDSFGLALCAIDADKLLVTAPGATVNGTAGVGSAYLFSTNGTIVSTFTNPIPVANGRFGRAITALDSQRVLVSADKSDASGVAYLFNTNGTLLSTFLNPTPAANEFFGSSLATLGDLIVIGARQDSPNLITGQVGSVHLFKTNGVLLRTIPNPSFFNSQDMFGCSVATLGSNEVIIGASEKAASGHAPGGVYLYAVNFLPLPELKIEPVAGGSLRISWPYPSTGFVLEQCGNPPSTPDANAWTSIPPPYGGFIYSSNGVSYARNSVTVGPITNSFYRLHQP
jgi:hypothetical protein